MSRADNCYDNAFMESCFGTIKTELEMTEYENSSQARGDIAGYLAYYNTDAAIRRSATSAPPNSKPSNPRAIKRIDCP